MPNATLFAACTGVFPDPVVSPNLDSGITSDSGSGTRTLGNNSDIGVTHSVAPV